MIRVFWRGLMAAALLLPAAILAAPQMLLPAAPQARLRMPDMAAPVDATAVRFNSAEMFAMKRLEQAEFRIPNGPAQAFVFELAQDHGGGIRTWIGHDRVRGNLNRAIITTGPEGTYGVISTPGREFRLVPGAGHDWLIDMSTLPETTAEFDDDFRLPPATKKAPEPLASPTYFDAVPGVNVAGIEKAAPTPNVYVDIMVLYTPGYLSFFSGSTSQVLTRINNLVARANTAYVDSEVAITLRLVYTQLVNYSDSTTTDQALSAITPDCTTLSCGNAFDPNAFGNIETLRNTYGADVVALLRGGSAYSSDGLAWIPWSHSSPPAPSSRYMYSVTTGCPALCDMVFIHEVGHNMGNMHDRSTSAWQSGGSTSYGYGAYNYGFGYAYCATGALACDPTIPSSSGGCSSQPECSVADKTTNFSDLMAYFQGSTNRNYKFSNPAVTCSGSNTATARACGDANNNAALSMNNLRQALSAVKAEAGSTPPPAATSTTLAPSINPSVSGQSITLTAQVSSSGSTPGGTVAFLDGAATITNCASMTLSAGVAKCTVSLAAGTHNLTAKYAGTTTYAASTSAAVSEVVNAAPTIQLLSGPSSAIDFGANSMMTTSPTMTATITNTSGIVVTVLGLAASANYAIVSSNCLTQIGAGATCQVVLSFTPGSAGTVAGQLSITYNGGGPTIVNLTGVGERSLTTHYYRSILNRDPDAAGKAFWDGEAARMASLGADLREAYYVMAGYFFNSAEYLSYGKTDAQFVTDLYNTFFNRGPDAGGLGYWVGQIQGGLPRDVVLFSFMFSSEFQAFSTSVFGNVAARPEVNLVMDFFRGILNRLPDTSAFNFWVTQLKSAQCQGAGAVYKAVNDMSYQFIFGPEYTNRNRANGPYVTDLYYSFLRRGGDSAGVNFWVNQLNTAAEDRNSLRADFIASPEFGARVTATIQAGCAP